MDEFLKMDVFFVIASIATLAVGALACVVLWYLIRVLKVMDRIAREVEEEAHALRADIGEVRAAAHREGAKLSGMAQAFEAMVRNLVGRKPPRRRKPAPHEASS